MIKLKFVPVAVLLLLLTPKLSIAQDFENVEITTTKLTDSVYMLEGEGGNIGLCVGKDGAFIVDDQFAPLTEKIQEAIAGVTPLPVQFVVNTHWHFDHTGGNENFGEAGAIIVSHENSRKRLSSDQLIKLLDIRQEALAYAGLPKITFGESMTFHFNGETIELLHVGHAHTDGDAIVYFRESNVLHMGDVFVDYGFPFIDEPNGGNINGLIETVFAAAELADSETQIIPGHGQVAGKEDLVQYGEMLKTVRDRVRTLVQEGKSFEEIMDSDPMRGFRVTEFMTADNFIQIVYNNLTEIR